MTRLRALGLSLGIVFCLYPKFFTFQAFPMVQGSWQLRDTEAALTTFLPGFRVIQWELFHHGNLLWSGLRSLGLPLLADNMQTAPLFPLNLLLVWLPENFFWNIYVVLRLVLLGMGSFLLAKEILGFKEIGAFFFTLTFGYGLYVLQSINHPWLNGFLAGVWYLYFLGKCFSPKLPGKYSVTLGIALSVYSLVTCGFPEAAALSGLLAFFVFIGPFLKAVRSPKKSWVWPLVSGHVIGLTLSSYQLFAFLELMSTAWANYRETPGLSQFESPLFLIHQVLRLNSEPPPTITHYFNLIPITLFFAGLLFRIRGRKLHPFDLSAITCFLFFVLKGFPIWPWFNRLFASFPILKSCYFTGYFFPVLLWPFAYFAAVGADSLFEKGKANQKNITPAATLTFLCALLALFLTNKVEWGRTVLLIAIWLTFIFLSRLSIKKKTVLICLTALLEFSSTRPPFLEPYPYLRLQNAVGKEIVYLLEKNGISPNDIRERSPTGNYLSEGIATADGGYAILPERLSLLRTTLFKTPDNFALFPFEAPKFTYSWRFLSVGLHVERMNPFNRRRYQEPSGLKELGTKNGESIRFDKLALSRTFTASGCRTSDDKTATAKQISEDFTLGEVVLEDLPPREKAFCRGFKGKYVPVHINKDMGSRLELEEVKGPAILVLNDTFYPGWKVTDELTGNQLSIYPANLAFRGTILPDKKNYRLQYSYQPRWAGIAALSTWAAGLLLLGLGFLTWMERKRKSHIWR